MKLESFVEIKGALRSKKYRQVEESLSKKKGDRTKALDKLVATNTAGQLIDADEKSMDRFDRVISLGIAQVMLAKDPNNTAWDTVTFPWVDANNKVILISLRQAIELQADGLSKLSTVWGV